MNLIYFVTSLERIIERRLRDAKFGCMPGRGMADAIFAVRQRMAK